eukprot:CAMPEP_0170607030 /NCGR_PEP_ID=MMETSP0224-20130122/20833_1 /TAXON_ID=285029 /ORGANISM="Togula jolla, Strain CCCM 725" /LENGTH=198 /DNA_ID=CAMNT_0010932161 /DNA_START=177 /DNA_END=773 /DNA_ORIENTATION=+
MVEGLGPVASIAEQRGCRSVQRSRVHVQRGAIAAVATVVTVSASTAEGLLLRTERVVWPHEFRDFVVVMGLLALVQLHAILALHLPVANVRGKRYHEAGQEEEDQGDEYKDPVRQVPGKAVVVRIDRPAPDADHIEEPPEAEAAEGEELDNAPAHEAKVEVVEAENASEEGDEESLRLRLPPLFALGASPVAVAGAEG